MRALLLALSLAGPAVAQDRCIAACAEVTTEAEAAKRAQAALGLALPTGATVVGLVEGGFQDAFVQARIEVERSAMDALLKRLGIERTMARPSPDAYLGPPAPAWFEDVRSRDPWFAPATLSRFAHAMVGVAPGEGTGFSLLLWAFQA